ncbi:MAG: hypothetical protein U0802_04315 [Candidatus Binatia bacterium]
MPLCGNHAERLVDAIAADPLLGERYDPSLPVTQAELEFALRRSGAHPDRLPRAAQRCCCGTPTSAARWSIRWRAPSASG